MLFLSLFSFQVNLFGQNVRQQLQFRRHNSKKPLRPRLKSTQQVKVHTCFVAGEFGTKCFRHAKKVPYKRKKGKRLENIKVNGNELARAVRKTIGPWLQQNGCDTLFCDCVRVNHSPPVKKALAEFGVSPIPSAGEPHNVKNGSPPTSHDTSILDGNMFNTFQHEVSVKTLKQKSRPEKQSKGCDLYDNVKKVWESEKYREKARSAMKKLPNALRAIVKARGGPTGR